MVIHRRGRFSLSRGSAGLPHKIGRASTMCSPPSKSVVTSIVCFRFRLICCVNESEDNCMSIGTKATITPTASGQLFCYANDVPNMYWNNKGKLDLQISAL